MLQNVEFWPFQAIIPQIVLKHCSLASSVYLASPSSHTAPLVRVIRAHFMQCCLMHVKTQTVPKASIALVAHFKRHQPLRRESTEANSQTQAGLG
jgi:hypothetical protein